MNRKQRAVLLIALLCAAWVCSAAFMAAFAWHDCQAAHCPICPVLAQCLDVLFALSLFLPLLCKWASVRILRAQTKRAEKCAPREGQVRRQKAHAPAEQRRDLF